jgi:hypothetical protein
MATAAKIQEEPIAWEGGQCPVHATTRVQVQFRSDIGWEQAARASGPNGNVASAYSWANTGSAGDVVAYLVVQP